jgi:hypothetical protein
MKSMRSGSHEPANAERKGDADRWSHRVRQWNAERLSNGRAGPTCRRTFPTFRAQVADRPALPTSAGLMSLGRAGGQIPWWARSESGGPFRVVFVLFFSFSIPFSSYLSLNLNLHLNSNFDSSFSNHICAIKSIKFENIYLNILFMFSYSFSFPHFVQNPKFQFRVKLHPLELFFLSSSLLFYLMHKHIKLQHDAFLFIICLN